MSWTYVGGVTANTTSGTTLTMGSDLDVSAGDLLVAVVSWYEALSSDTLPTITIEATDGNANTFTMATGEIATVQAAGQMGYKINADAHGTATFQVTFSASKTRMRAIIMQWTPVDSASVALVGGGTGSSVNTAAASTSPVSNQISANGSDLLVVGGVAAYYGDPSSMVIGGEAADNTTLPSQASGINSAALGAERFTSNQTDITAGCTLSSTRYWVADILAFENTAAGGGSIVPILLNQRRMRN